MSEPSLHVIIPAGGAGTRLWPMSRRSRPKFLLDLTGQGRTLLQATVDRLESHAASITIVTGRAHGDAVLDQLPGFADRADRRLVIEPSGKDSMAAIGLATAIIRDAYGPDAVVGSFAADHVVERPELLHETIDRALPVARAGFITTIGIRPTEPSTAYGYIRQGEAIPVVADLSGVCDASNGPRAPRAWAGTLEHLQTRVVEEFVEKPDAATAQKYLDAGYVWNAGMFIMRAGTLFNHLGRLHADLCSDLQELAAAWSGPAHDEVFARVWPTCKKISIDHAIAEPVSREGGVAVVPAGVELGWTDLGDFAALSQKVSDRGEAVRVNASQTTVFNGTRQTVALVGVEDLIVVTTEDAILVTRAGAAQAVKGAVDVIARESDSPLL